MDRDKKVRQVDIDTGEEIEIYNSITDAAWDNWVTYDTVSRALNYNGGIVLKRQIKFEYV